MRVFITGATGFVGTALTKELLAYGHTVLGLTRSEQGATDLAGVFDIRQQLERTLDNIRYILLVVTSAPVINQFLNSPL